MGIRRKGGLSTLCKALERSRRSIKGRRKEEDGEMTRVWLSCMHQGQLDHV
jgi:hypothetical protein